MNTAEMSGLVVSDHEPHRWGRGVAAAILAGALTVTGACSRSGEHDTSTPGTAASAAPGTPRHTSEASPERHEGLRDPESFARAKMVYATFENSTLEPQYGYINNIGDGRGYTAGWYGVCSGTGDMRLVISTYLRRKPDSPLGQFVPRLDMIEKQYAATGWKTPVGSTEGLEELPAAWKAAAADKDFREVQDEIFDSEYRYPAIKLAEQVRTADGRGVTSAAGQLAIVDAAFNQGIGTDVDGLPHMLHQTADKVGDKPTEAEFVDEFLRVRSQHLGDAAFEKSKDGWRQALPRIRALWQIYHSGNPTLDQEMKFDVYQGDHWTIPAVSER